MPVQFDLPTTAPGLDVFVYQDDRSKIIARGQNAEQCNQYDSIRISGTKTRILITIQEVYVPGAVLDPESEDESI